MDYYVFPSWIEKTYYAGSCWMPLSVVAMLMHHALVYFVVIDQQMWVPVRILSACRSDSCSDSSVRIQVLQPAEGCTFHSSFAEFAYLYLP